MISRSIVGRASAARSPELLGPAERSSPKAAFAARGAGAGLDGESADRAIVMPPQCVSSSDTVREIEYQILQLPHGLELHRSVCVRCRVSGSDFGASLFQVRARPGVDAFWRGGNFGPEASVVTLVFGLLVSATLIVLAKRRKRSVP